MAQKKILLIVDDEKNTRDGLRDAFDEHYEVYVAADIGGAMAAMETEPADVVITDLRLGGEDGMELIDKVLKQPGPPICIMMTAYGSVDTAVEAMKRGAYDFVTKPVNIDRLEILIQRAMRDRALHEENAVLRQQARRTGLERMIGQSVMMDEVFETIRQVAPSRATVLIQGETGTGKELAAQAIHALSTRASKKFIAVHCKAFSPQLLESELFGHERGAFTGAFERRAGRFEQAAGGTLFLDEVGELDENTQVKILRVLGERTYERVGGNQTLQADVRLVAATNKDLTALMAEGTFRDDLYFRLNVVSLTMPPLRARKEDIPSLVQVFLKDSLQENEKPFREFGPEAMTCILDYDWPGNVRELRAAVEHAVVMSGNAKIAVRDLPPAVRQPAARSPHTAKQFRATGELNLQDSERLFIYRALEESDGNRTEAARKLGMSRRTLHRRLKELNISKTTHSP